MVLQIFSCSNVLLTLVLYLLLSPLPSFFVFLTPPPPHSHASQLRFATPLISPLIQQLFWFICAYAQAAIRTSFVVSLFCFVLFFFCPIFFDFPLQLVSYNLCLSFLIAIIVAPCCLCFPWNSRKVTIESLSAKSSTM